MVAPGSNVALIQPVREAVSYRGLFTAGWFGVREKHYSWLEIYDRLRASEQAEPLSSPTMETLEVMIYAISVPVVH